MFQEKMENLFKRPIFKEKYIFFIYFSLLIF